MTRLELMRELKAAGSAERAAGMARFFKTGAGQYGESDVFLGVSVPVLRSVARRYRTLGLDDLQLLLEAKEHEYRATALEILVTEYKLGKEARRKEIVAFYLSNTQYVNNWDLVDLSCRGILGEHLRTRSRKILFRLARSKSLWERRIAIVSTMTLVRAGEMEDAWPSQRCCSMTGTI